MAQERKGKVFELCILLIDFASILEEHRVASLRIFA